MSQKKGGFTLPGEAGYEALTLQLAEKWGADVIRDSDGTNLSPEIIQAGYDIYSTICIIRDHNAWAMQNEDKLQQTFLMSEPQIATEETLTIDLLAGYFRQQFKVNDSDAARAYWQVHNRTTNQLLSNDQWVWADGQVTILSPQPFHKYTVNFLAYRIWEEISMYNHVTNHWDKEHLMQIDPIHPDTQNYMMKWMEDWCETHPDTDVVRFTALFYNFVWIWGEDEKRRNRFTDWASYDFTVSPLALNLFAEQFGYQLTAEDFINQGKLHPTHRVPDKRKRDWMAFVNEFVVSFGRKLIDIVHHYGKKAYVFYDDSWVGMEPYHDNFKNFDFDGLIKCVFSGFEVRLCSGVKSVETHELRLHPYLFPLGLGGLPTFMEGGDPTADAKHYWIQVRRALLRASIERIGLGGYLHLTENYPDFNDYIAYIADEFRMIKACHEAGSPALIPLKVAILTAWGKLRSWTCSGHFHETEQHDLIHVLESLAGMPVDVQFYDFNDIDQLLAAGTDVVINAGQAGTAWSGGSCWHDENFVAKLTQWVYQGGCLIGINEPGAVSGYDTRFRMAHVFGIDADTGERVCHGRWQYDLAEQSLLSPACAFKAKPELYLTDGQADVLADLDGVPTVVRNKFGQGIAYYLTSYTYSPVHTRMLLNLLLESKKMPMQMPYLTTSNAYADVAWYPDKRKLLIVNNSDQPQTVTVQTEHEPITVTLAGSDIAVYDL